MRRYLLVTLVTGSLFLACSDGTTDPGEPTVTQVVVTAAASTLNALGATTQLTAVARDAASQVVTGQSVTWSSSASGVASVSSGGLVTAVANGTATLSAVVGGVTGTVAISVAQTVASVAVGPATVPSLTAVGATTNLTASAQDARGNAMTGVALTWSSSNAAVATVANGTVTAVSNGTATITATAAGGIAAGKAVTVAQAVTSVVITPPTLAAFDAIGATGSLGAEARDVNNNPIPGTAITWATSSAPVATVTTSGLVTSAGNGTTRITAGASGHLDTVNVTVAQVANNILLTCAGTALDTWGATRQCTGVVRDRLNVAMAGSVAWSSSSPSVATVSGSGLMTAKDNGSTNIVATFGLLSAQSAQTVDFKIAFGGIAQGTFETAGPLHEYDITGGGATRNLVAWIHRSPIGTAGLDPHFFIDNGSFARGGVTSGRLDGGAEIFGHSRYNNTVATQLVSYGEASSVGGYVMGLVDCREPMGAFPTAGYYNWAQIQAGDCAVLNGPSLGTPNLTSAVMLRIDQLTAGDNVTIEIAAGCSPLATANAGCTGSAGSMDPYVYVFGPNNAQVWADDDGADGTNSRVVINPVPTTGTYTVLITTYGNGQAGVFTVCAFVNCSTSSPPPGGAPAAPSTSRTAPTDWSVSLTVEQAYARLEAMGIVPRGFDPQRARAAK